MLSLSLLAGSVAAFNPCGFALLPAYLGLIARPSNGSSHTRNTHWYSLARGVRFAAGMTVGFMIVFGVAAAIFLPFAGVVARTLPYVTIAIGVVLVSVGGWLLAGRELQIPKLPGFSGRAPSGSWLSQIGYGITFAVASLSCTIGPFLAMVSIAAAADSPGTSIAAFAAYALGMGSVVLVIAVIVTMTSGALVARIRGAAPIINRVSGVLLLVAGAYVAWYGWFELRILANPNASDSVVSAVTGAQSAVTTWVSAAMSTTLIQVLVMVLGGLAVLAAVTFLFGPHIRMTWERRRCRSVRRYVDRYLDADPSAPLSDARVAEVEAHLDACSGCTNLVEDLRGLRRMLREFDAQDARSLERVQRTWNRFREELRS